LRSTIWKSNDKEISRGFTQITQMKKRSGESQKGRIQSINTSPHLAGSPFRPILS
jgi:hypothetical protein